MIVSGSVRMSPSGVDIALFTGKAWEKLEHGPLYELLSEFYSLVVSDNHRRAIHGRLYEVEVRSSPGGGATRAVRFTTQCCNFTLTQYPTDRDGIPNPADKVNLRMEIPTSRSSAPVLDFEEVGQEISYGEGVEECAL